jgi:chromosome segregation protein
MLKSLHVSNYRSLGEKVQVDFGDGLTVLVGPNGAGKSNVMDVLRFVADATQMGLSGPARGSERFAGGAAGARMTWPSSSH